MIIFDETNHPIILDNINGPTISEYLWALDLTIMDYTLIPLYMLEETTCPSMQLCVNGFDFILPAYWNILVYDQDTAQLDVVELAETAGREFTALVYGPKARRPSPVKIQVTNYFVEYRNVGPFLHKHQLLCHPINSTEWVSVGPSDCYNKYLKDSIVGDIIGY